MKSKITAIIEVTQDGGFSAFSESVPGVYANGSTDTEVRTEFITMMQEQADYVAEITGSRPKWADADVQFIERLTSVNI